MNPLSVLRRGRLWLALLATAALALAAAELASRQVLGLGTPPLYEADADYEYRLLPGQDVQRFGNRVRVNQWGMRADEFGARKASADELRVLVVGDSVVNGGSQIDQRQLASTLLQHSLQTALGRPVTVGNVSTGSWGPGNWLAYARRHGFHDADLVLLVVNSGDYADNPAYAPLGVDFPTRPPVLALQEAALRYLPRYLPALAPAQAGPEVPGEPAAAEVARGLADLDAYLALARAEGRKVLVLHHPDREELASGRYLPGYTAMGGLLQGLGVDFVELAPTYRPYASLVYRDGIHLGAAGQLLLAQALHGAALRALGALGAPAAGDRLLS